MNRYLFFVLLIIFSLFESLQHLGSGETIPELIGSILAFIIMIIVMSLGLGFFVWLIIDRSTKTTVYQIVINFMTVVVFVMLMSSQAASHKNNVDEKNISGKTLNDLITHGEKYQESISSGDSDGIGDAQIEFVNSFANSFDELAQSSTGSEKKYYEIISNYMKTKALKSEQWIKSIDSVMAERIFDFSLLKNEGEFKYQFDVINKFVEMGKAQLKFTDGTIDFLEEELGELTKELSLASTFLEKLKVSHDKRSTIELAYFTANIDYGNNMIDILKLLQSKTKMWIYDNDEGFTFEDPSLEKEYSNKIESLTVNENDISDLYDKLLEMDSATISKVIK